MEFPMEVPNNGNFETIPVEYIMETNQTENVQYVYQDDNMGIPVDYQNITDLILEDGTRAMLVNGTLVTADGQALVIQDEADLNQFSVEVDNESQNQFVQIMVPQDINNTTQNVIRYVQEETAIKSEPNDQIFYIQQENILQPVQEQHDTAENPNQIGQLIQLADDQIIVDENGDVVDLEELLSKEQQNGDYQYTVMADGAFGLSNVPAAEREPDISEIRGKNIATGEVITISQYLQKIKNGQSFANSYTSKNSMNTMRFDAQTKKKSSVRDLKKLINKKIPIGQTDKGKNLVAKITKIMKKYPSKSPINAQNTILSNKKQLLNVGKKKIQPRIATRPAILETKPMHLTEVESDPTAIESEPVTEVTKSAVVETPPTTAETASETEPMTVETQPAVTELLPISKVIVQKKKIRKEAFDVISKTLSGLMNMASVVKKLKNKTLVVTMMEKMFNQETKKYSKNISYCIGFMIREYELDSADGEFLENWKFILDSNSSEIILEQNHNGSIIQKNTSDKKRSYANLTIEITQNAAGEKNTKVIINPPVMFQCKSCGISYKTSALLKMHCLEKHSQPDPKPSLECKKCLIKFKTFSEAEEHDRLSHPSYCSICKLRFHNLLALKKHTMSEHTKKPESESKENEYNKFSCNICNRRFSRHSNLLRHIEIHKGDGANYQCAICYCSYHFVSSLTRHIVSNHVEKKPLPEVPLTTVPEFPNEIITQIEGFDFLQNDQIVQMIPLENISEDALEQILQDAAPEIVQEETGPR